MNASPAIRTTAVTVRVGQRRQITMGRRRATAGVFAWTPVMLACLAVPNAALGQPRLFRVGPLIQHYLPKVVVDEPNFAIVERSSGSTRNKLKHLELACPDDMRAMSVGYSAASGRGEPDDWRVILSQPTDDGKGWTVFAMFDGSGDKDANGVSGVPAPYEWSLRVRIVCARMA